MSEANEVAADDPKVVQTSLKQNAGLVSLDEFSESSHDSWPSSVLSLDGGGIRGYSSLLILERLMSEIAIWERSTSAHADAAKEQRSGSEDELLPSHYFDFMYGTSTGGLIATVLGRLRMSVLELVNTYQKLEEDVFHQPSQLHDYRFRGRIANRFRRLRHFQHFQPPDIGLVEHHLLHHSQSTPRYAHMQLRSSIQR
ncbi:hypothetical protein LTS18_009579, partial [Coniosporium uncinatum]